VSRSIFVAASIAAFSAVPTAAQSPPIGWPDTIDLLTKERSQAQECANLLKNAGDGATIMQGRITYDAAKSAADGAISGLTTALVQGGKPESLPGVQADLGQAGAGLHNVCDAAVKAAQAVEGKRGLINDIVTAAVGPVIDALKSAAGALWAHHLEMDKLEMETIKGQLEAARWPDF
jgi:hypothetical protein